MRPRAKLDWTRITRWLRGLWPDRNPLRRACDRAEAAIGALLLGAFLIGAPLLALACGQWAASAALRAQDAQRATRYQVTAVIATLGIGSPSDCDGVGLEPCRHRDMLNACAPFVRARALFMVAPEDEMRRANYQVTRQAFELLRGPKRWYDTADGTSGCCTTRATDLMKPPASRRSFCASSWLPEPGAEAQRPVTRR